MIYDNVESARTVRSFCPAGEQGTIIVTTQNCGMRHMTTSEIALPSMSADEGSELPGLHLKGGDSEQDSAKRLSDELGCLPLAIALFVGYVVRSDCSLDHILDSVQQRLKSSQIWSQSDLASVSGYRHTLETVWNLAFRRLSPDAKELINMMAFLQADNITEATFVRDQDQLQHYGWGY
jgi:hypothetical protein